MTCAVFDTNVLVSALWKEDSLPAALLHCGLCPVWSDALEAEYEDVLHRKKFRFCEEKIAAVLAPFRENAVRLTAAPTGISLPDPKDNAVYDLFREANRRFGAVLVTGNRKHFPAEDADILTPRECFDALSG